MRLFLIICFYSLFLGTTSSQLNLIRNPSFEQFDSCTAFQGNINEVTYWANANQLTPDYFQYCNTFPVGVPTNFLGYANAFDGVAYIGLGTANNNFREAVQGQFDTVLTQGRNYCWSMYISVADTMKFIIDEIGVYFSTDSIVATNYTTDNLNMPYQLKLKLGGVSDTSGWNLISGNYVASGEERFFVISFFSQNLVWTQFRNSVFNDGVAYYYIDQVSLIECEYPNYMIPGGFSPNGDGVNDYFEILNLDSYPQNSLQVLNRWGDLVYTASPYNNQWDGTANTGIRLGSGKVTDGTYFYVFSPSPGALPVKGALEIRNSH